MKALKQAETMSGKTYQYGNRIHYVIEVKNLGDKVQIRTNLETYERSHEALTEFLSYWKEASEVNELRPARIENIGVDPLAGEKNTVDKLTELLMDNIEKVKGDANYIKQATSINNNVNSIINLTKLKLDVLKAGKRGTL